MRKIIPLFLSLLPIAGFGQSPLTIDTQRCLYRAGDNLAWVAPDVDETGWRPYDATNLRPSEPHIWVRCHADLSNLRNASHPALQVTLYAAYQLYVDGHLIGAAGNLRNGRFNLDTTREWPSPEAYLGPNTSIALRITRRVSFIVPEGAVPPLEIAAGNQLLLRNQRAASLLDEVTGVGQISGFRTTVSLPICFGIFSALGAVILGLWLYDRSRSELLPFGIFSLTWELIYADFLAGAAHLKISIAIWFAVFAIASFVQYPSFVIFSYSLARRRIPVSFWIALTPTLALTASILAIPFLPLNLALWLDIVRSRFWDLFLISNVLTSLAPFVAFTPWSDVKPNMKPLAAMCMAVGASTASFFLLLVVYRFTHSYVISQWANNVAGAQAIVLLCLITALLGLLFRDQQQTARERALLAGEMQAARNVQHYLIPDHLPPTPGLSVQSEFHPAREVGGDFFQVLPQPDGSTLIFIGDVAGKGIEAGMLATLILGAIRTAAAFTSDPERILCLLNDRLRGRGLVTCIALRIEQDGAVALVNAGHLPPYLNGVELAVEGALPLGAVPGIAFVASRFNLSEGDSLILMTDGVVEAQNAEGHLFGFERVGDLLSKGTTGTALASSAQSFGQEDDITVLTLTFAPVEVAHA